jgi:hypothetical protein
VNAPLGQINHVVAADGDKQVAVSPHRHERPDVRADMAIRLAYLELRRPASVFPGTRKNGRRVSMKRAVFAVAAPHPERR